MALVDILGRQQQPPITVDEESFELQSDLDIARAAQLEVAQEFPVSPVPLAPPADQISVALSPVPTPERAAGGIDPLTGAILPSSRAPGAQTTFISSGQPASGVFGATSLPQGGIAGQQVSVAGTPEQVIRGVEQARATEGPAEAELQFQREAQVRADMFAAVAEATAKRKRVFTTSREFVENANEKRLKQSALARISSPAVKGGTAKADVDAYFNDFVKRRPFESEFSSFDMRRFLKSGGKIGDSKKERAIRGEIKAYERDFNTFVDQTRRTEQLIEATDFRRQKAVFEKQRQDLDAQIKKQQLTNLQIEELQRRAKLEADVLERQVKPRMNQANAALKAIKAADVRKKVNTGHIKVVWAAGVQVPEDIIRSTYKDASDADIEKLIALNKTKASGLDDLQEREISAIRGRGAAIISKRTRKDVADRIEAGESPDDIVDSVADGEDAKPPIRALVQEQIEDNEAEIIKGATDSVNKRIAASQTAFNEAIVPTLETMTSLADQGNDGLARLIDIIGKDAVDGAGGDPGKIDQVIFSALRIAGQASEVTDKDGITRGLELAIADERHPIRSSVDRVRNAILRLSQDEDRANVIDGRREALKTMQELGGVATSLKAEFLTPDQDQVKDAVVWSANPSINKMLTDYITGEGKEEGGIEGENLQGFLDFVGVRKASDGRTIIGTNLVSDGTPQDNLRVQEKLAKMLINTAFAVPKATSDFMDSIFDEEDQELMRTNYKNVENVRSLIKSLSGDEESAFSFKTFNAPNQPSRNLSNTAYDTWGRKAFAAINAKSRELKATGTTVEQKAGIPTEEIWNMIEDEDVRALLRRTVEGDPDLETGVSEPDVVLDRLLASPSLSPSKAKYVLARAWQLATGNTLNIVTTNAGLLKDERFHAEDKLNDAMRASFSADSIEELTQRVNSIGDLVADVPVFESTEDLFTPQFGEADIIIRRAENALNAIKSFSKFNIENLQTRKGSDIRVTHDRISEALANLEILRVDDPSSQISIEELDLPAFDRINEFNEALSFFSKQAKAKSTQMFRLKGAQVSGTLGGIGLAF